MEPVAPESGLEPLKQRYTDPYVMLGTNGEFYVMSGGVRTRHSSLGECHTVIDASNTNRLTR